MGGSCATAARDAQARVARAVQLDPQFERAIAAKKLNEDVQAFVGMLVADYLLLDRTRWRLWRCEKEQDQANRWISLGMEPSLRGSPWDYWHRAQESFGLWREIEEENPDPIPVAESIAALVKLQTPHGNYFKAVAELSLQVDQLLTAIENPTGTLVDYRRTVSDKQQQVLELVKRVNSARPDGNSLNESVAAVASFQLFRTPSETEPIIEKYGYLIDS